MSVDPQCYEPDYAVPPGRTLQELLDNPPEDCLVVTKADLAETLELSLYELDEVLSGKREITENMATWLSIIFGTPRKFWLNLEVNYQKTLKRLGQERP